MWCHIVGNHMACCMHHGTFFALDNVALVVAAVLDNYHDGGFPNLFFRVHYHHRNFTLILFDHRSIIVVQN